MKLTGHRTDLSDDDAGPTKPRRDGRGLGPFTGTQLTLIIGMLAVVVAFPMVVSAVIPNGSTYNACALKTTGALRVVDTSKHQACKATETKLSWSKTGAKGAAGVPGARGLPGSARAYALVHADGTVIVARSKNIAVTRVGGTGGLVLAYCIGVLGGVDPATIAPIVAPVIDVIGGGGTGTLFALTDPASVTSLCGGSAPNDDFVVEAPSVRDFTVLIP